MSINGAIFSQLSTDTAVAAFVASRIYPIQSPDLPDGQAMPTTLVYGRVGMRPEATLSSGPKYFVATYGFICASLSYDAAHDLADAVITALYKLIFPSKVTLAGVSFESCRLTDSRDDAENTAVERGIFTVYVEFEFSFK